MENMWATTEAYRENPESISAHVIAITTLHVVDADKKGVVHDIKALEEFRISPQLFRQESTFLWADLQCLASIDPIEVLQHRSRIHSSLLLRIRLDLTKNSLQIL